MTWPLEPEGMRQFAEGLEEILVVEEKRQVIEYQLKEQLYNWREDVRPRVIGKFDEKGEWALPHGDWLLPAPSELTPAMIARAIAGRIARFHTSERIRAAAGLPRRQGGGARPPARSRSQRVPYFCSGCPHNTLDQGAGGQPRAGRHRLPLHGDLDGPRDRQTFTPDGRRRRAVDRPGAVHRRRSTSSPTSATAPTSTPASWRSAPRSPPSVNITYKILYNDAVAMTGGQPVDGPLTRAADRRASSRPRASSGSSSSPTSRRSTRTTATSPAGVRVRAPRRARRGAARAARDHAASPALIYDQTCAAEKRRRRKRGTLPRSGQARRHQRAGLRGLRRLLATSRTACRSCRSRPSSAASARSTSRSCNKDYSCVKGFCPSFVTVEGGTLRKGKAAGRRRRPAAPCPSPTLPALAEPYGILVTGVGGTGVVTIGALLGMAAHLEGKGVTVLDMTGLAQKGGAVWSHVRIAAEPEQLYAPRIAAGEADAGARLRHRRDGRRRGAGQDAARAAPGRWSTATSSVTSEFVRTVAEQARTGDLDRFRDPRVPDPGHGGPDRRRGRRRTPPSSSTPRRLATALMGDCHRHQPVHARLRLAEGPGAALGEAAILRAIELNGVAVEPQPGGLPLGPPRRARPGAGRALGGTGRRRPRQPPPVDEPRRDDRAPRRRS